MDARESIVVAVDGSRGSSAAVAWAATEARLSGRPLSIVHVADTAIAGRGASMRFIRAEIRRLSRPVVYEARDLAIRFEPTLAPRTAVLLGGPSRVLLGVSEHAHLLVLGWTGTGSLSQWLLGSVPQRLMANARCPVLVVANQPGSVAGHAVERIVVGFRDVQDDGDAVEFALDMGARRGVPVVLAHVEVDDPLSAEARDRVEAWRAAHPDVTLTLITVDGEVGKALTAECGHNDLLVLGRHRHHALTPRVLGAHIRSVLETPPGAVAVVPAAGTETVG